MGLREAGEIAAKEIASRLGRELGAAAGMEAGLTAGGAAGAEAGKAEVAKHNALEMSAEQIAAVKANLVQIGSAAGKEPGTAAGTWLPDGYSWIFRSYVFGPSGFWTMAPLRCKILSLPFLGLRQGGGRGATIQGKEGIKFCSVV